MVPILSIFLHCFGKGKLKAILVVWGGGGGGGGIEEMVRTKTVLVAP